MTHRALVLINRGSRKGGGDLSAAFETFRRAGMEIIERSLGKGADPGALIRECRNEVDCVVIGGGDGTVQRAAAALMESGLPLGILPLGTANDLARTLDLPLDLEQAAERIAAGRVRKIDVSRANGHLFFNVAHIGLGARLRATLSPELKKKWGSLSYIRALAQTLAERRAFRAQVEHDGTAARFRSIQIAVGNGRYYGGGIAISQHAGIEDGLLHLYTVAPASPWKLLRAVFPLMRGVAKDPEAVQKLQARRLRIETERPMTVVADGERITTTPVEIEVLPATIAVLAGAQKEAE
jgi:YegS/Rv2252/BmrU family lipid kinase